MAIKSTCGASKPVVNTETLTKYFNVLLLNAEMILSRSILGVSPVISALWAVGK